ncbi:34085_t:CDS:2 [Gigaspora margarita]|uniref:34085_t:CDS:1 n=1 Tax=Gigaspora margarita TaxID=4874 RepID=A0ABN7W759_GIGMA|nr:34085_t:CDS:2 [Gigaspora margarita]
MSDILNDILVFIGFNDVPTAPGFRNGIKGQTKAAIIENLTENGATSYNNIIFTFPNGFAIGVWANQIKTNIPWVKNQSGVQNVCNSVTRINQITTCDTCDTCDTEMPLTTNDIENFSHVFY